jgi:hypothetical protein
VPGDQIFFSDDLVLERYDDSTPGSGLPTDQSARLAGTQSRVLTLVRVAAGGDPFFSVDSRLFQFEGTYKFNALDGTPYGQAPILKLRCAAAAIADTPFLEPFSAGPIARTFQES